MPRRGRPPGRRPRPPRDRSCSTCGEDHQGDGAGQLPGYFGHGNMGEMDGPEFYPDPVTGLPNGPRWGRRGNGGGRGIGPGRNTNETINSAWAVGNDSDFEVWNNGRLVASGGDRLTHGGGRRGGEHLYFDDDFSDDFDDFGGGPFERESRRGPGSNPFGGRSPRGRGQLPPGMEFVPPWLFDDFDEDDFHDFEITASFGGMPLGRRERGPRRGGREGIRITRQGGAMVVDNQFGSPPHRGPGRSGLDIMPDEDYNADDYDGGDDDHDGNEEDEEAMGGSSGGRFQDRVYRTRNGGTLRIHSGW